MGKARWRSSIDLHVLTNVLPKKCTSIIVRSSKCQTIVARRKKKPFRYTHIQCYDVDQVKQYLTKIITTPACWAHIRWKLNNVSWCMLLLWDAIFILGWIHYPHLTIPPLSVGYVIPESRLIYWSLPFTSHYTCRMVFYCTRGCCQSDIWPPPYLQVGYRICCVECNFTGVKRK